MPLEQLVALLELQDTDINLIKTRKAYLEIESNLKREGGLQDVRDKLSEAKAKELECKLHVAHLAADINQFKAEQKRLEERLYGGAINSVKELKAVETEQAANKLKLEQTEQMIPIAEANLENAKLEHEQMQATAAERTESWKKEAEELIKEIKQYALKYKELSEARSKIVANVPKIHMATYKSLFKTSGGQAVARVERGICLGCNISLPAGELTESKISQKLPRCLSCDRILVFD